MDADIVCSRQGKGHPKGPRATPGRFFVSIGVLTKAMQEETAALHALPWERHPLTCFGKPGVAAEETPAPKQRALLLSDEPVGSPPFTYQPHRGGGLQQRPNLSMTTRPCSTLGAEGVTAAKLMPLIIDHNSGLDFGVDGLACVKHDGAAANGACAESGVKGTVVRNIGEALAYCGGEGKLLMHHCIIGVVFSLFSF